MRKSSIDTIIGVLLSILIATIVTSKIDDTALNKVQNSLLKVILNE